MKASKATLAALCAWLLSGQTHAHTFNQQAELQQFAAQATIEFAVISNFNADGQFSAALKLNNKSSVELAAGQGNWQIYFHSIRKLTERELFGLKLTHVQGDLHRLQPTAQFKGLAPQQQLEFALSGGATLVSYSDFMPRAFIVAGTLQPEIFQNTNTEQLQNFVAPIVRPEQQLRYQQPKPDLYPIATAASRYQDNLAVNQVQVPETQWRDRIFPSPLQVTYQRGRTELNANWQIQFTGRLRGEAEYLQQRLQESGLKLAFASTPASKAPRIQLQVDSSLTQAESYQLSITDKAIVITAADNAGAFYGLQSLLSLLPASISEASVSLPRLQAEDAPRYGWRGMHYDMARNFHGKAVTLRLIEQMGRMKLNKLHLHLTEDEGWRLEIPGLPELTEIGGKRCFDLTEQQCLLTQLGTGPDASGSGNGFYSRADFIEILKFAAARHIEIIPEIDLPGHARAAVKAMAARAEKLKAAGQPEAAAQFLLSDPADQSTYLTVQNYNDNSVNVCLESTYAFVDKVVYELQQMYRDAGLRMTTFHMGGDEVGKGSWQGSPVCQALFAQGKPGLAGVADLKPYFVSRVADILATRQLALGGWEDGLMYDPLTPFNRAQFANKTVYANAWDNIWEWGYGDRAYRLANAGYQVVMSHGTHLYFDHPHEAHPEERGYYWAARYTDAAKVFGYMPDHLYLNADKTREGHVIEDLEALLGQALPALEKPENILGIQGQVWSETIRTATQLEQMIYPRMYPLAERAWHKASWEGSATRSQAQAADWQVFVRMMTLRELPKLSQAGAEYYLPPAGAVVVEGQLKANSAFPGLLIEYSLDGGVQWLNYDQNAKDQPRITEEVRNSGLLLVRTKNSHGQVSRSSPVK